MKSAGTVGELTETLRQGGYLADRGLATALFVALSLNGPILLEGEVGVGKTEVAKVIASVFGRKLIRLQCYEGIDTNQALYEWDYARQMLHIRALSEHQSSRGMLVQFLRMRTYADTVRLDGQAALGTPGRHRLHQEPVRAADVEECPVAGDPLGDVPPGLLPRLLVAAGPRTLLGCRPAQVSRLESTPVVRVDGGECQNERNVAVTGRRNMTDGLVLPPGTGHRLHGAGMTLKVGAEQSGKWSAFEADVSPGFDVGAHRHAEA